MSGDHKKRPEPAQTGPNRAWHRGPSPSDPDTKLRSFGTSPEVSEIVADAVRVGYEVIGRNLADGRVAADRFNAGTYQADDVPSDVMRLGKRLLKLTRELSATGFDLMSAALNDPAIRAAIQPGSGSPTPGGNADPRPAPMTCVFRGARDAISVATTLQQPDAPTTLSIAALHPASGAGTPITKIRFGAPQVGRGVVAIVTIPDDQAAGTYTGSVNDAGTGKALGTLTIEVLPMPAGSASA